MGGNRLQSPHSLGTGTWKGFGNVMDLGNLVKKLALRGLGSSEGSVVGVAFQPAGLWMAHVVQDRRGLQLLFCRYLEGASLREKEARLRKMVQDNELTGQSCVGVLSPDAYQLLQTKKPQGISPQEMNKVIRWQVRHLVRIPPQHALFETYPQPPRREEGAPEINVVAVSAEIVRNMNEVIWQSGLKSKAVDINELALRNVTECMPDPLRVKALLHFFEEQGMVLFVGDGDVYLTIRLGVGLKHLASAAARDGAGGASDRRETDAVCHAVATDLRRGMNFYAEQFHDPPVEGLIVNVAKDAPYSAALLGHLRQQFRLETDFLAWDEIFRQQDQRLPVIPTGALPAIGAALRLFRRKKA